MTKTLKFLQDAQTFYVATMDGDQPRVRPFGAVCSHEGKLYFGTANNKDCYRQMMDNPNVEISAMAGDKWIRLTGTVARDDSHAAKKAMFDAHPVLHDMYKIDDGIFEVLYFTKATAAICSFTSEPEVEMF